MFRSPPVANIVRGKHNVGGNGSNFGHGYNYCDELSSTFLNQLRRQVEKCDCFNVTGTRLAHSASGGTGGGFGSRCAELVREHYPKAYLASTLIGSSSYASNNIVETLNAALTVSVVQSVCDVIFLFDTTESRYHTILRESGVRGLNTHIAQSLTDVFYGSEESDINKLMINQRMIPQKGTKNHYAYESKSLLHATTTTAKSTTRASLANIDNNTYGKPTNPYVLSGLVTALAPEPTKKFIELFHLNVPIKEPFVNDRRYKAKALKEAKQVRQRLFRHCKLEPVLYKIFSRASFYRKDEISKMRKVNMGEDPTIGNRSLTLTCNLCPRNEKVANISSTSFFSRLDRSVSVALDEGVFLHHFQRFGIERDHLEQAKSMIEMILQ
eukprot:g1399.t1